MTPKPLSSYFGLNRRYYRSVNLVRDLDKPDAVQGYVPTEIAAGALRRILPAFSNPRAHRAWTITGVYGTGKSAFAHYLTALGAGDRTAVKQEALAIAHQAFASDSLEFQAITTHIPPGGLLRVVATGQREPLSWTVARALVLTAQRFWRDQPQPDFWPHITDWEVELSSREPNIHNQQVLSLLKEVVQAAATPMLLVVDELGKTLEYASHNQGVNDLYLLQQVAELELSGDHQVYFIGLLHQSFAGYSERLAAVEQSEWAKIQGRFEDIAFTESPSQMTRLIGQAMDRSQADPILCAIHNQAGAWFEALAPVLNENDVSREVLAAAYPLHPIAALVLPLLCTRYAQNDRSLFTFLTSDEPYGLQEFLAKTIVEDDPVPTLKLHQLYDYFVESVTGLSSRVNLQRWVEVQGLIEDARDRDTQTLQILKTIGILNLITTTGDLRATPELVALALCDDPHDQARKRWHRVIKDLQKRSLVTYRKQRSELRLWQGSDFNVEAAIYNYLEQERSPLADLMAQAYPLKPLVAQRHYSATGTLRYFEQRYGDSRLTLGELECGSADYDGTILYWLDRVPFAGGQTTTRDGKPLIVVEITQLDLLVIRARELQALQVIWKTAPELTQDGVARREVKQRLVEAERLLDETVRQTFDWANGENRGWVEGQQTSILSARAFQSVLSGVCDRVYLKTPVLDNELINRRVLTSQGAKARRVLLEAMLEWDDKPRLGLEGYGPEVSMYYSALGATGIHRQEEGVWGFYPPQEKSGIWSLWEAIERFCLSAKQQQRSLDDLYRQLEQPPYGVKPGMVPVVFAAVLLYHVDDVGFYKDGIFVPVMGPEYFELLVKDPTRFSVKYFEMVGLRSQVFQELESILRSPNAKTPTGVRNASLLVVAKPLFSFVRKLPKYTLNTQRISDQARQVIVVLQQAQEPDELLFVALPQACGFEPMTTSEGDGTVAKAFRKQLVQALHEIQTAYEALLSFCKTRLYEAFGVRQEVNLREDLQVQAMLLLGKCIEPVLKRFILAAVDGSSGDQEWLEALMMIVADKPPKSWTDEDITRFEIALSDLIRRFKSLEALQKEVEAKGKGFTAKRLTITEQDGHEVNQVIWVDDDKESLLNQAVDKALALPELQGDIKLYQAFIAKLSERIFSAPSSELVSPPKARKRAI
ncbi:hypothetical protein [Leptolyngbya sp. PCC 6406]|uniref:hypothetical protein n=1 Tax=Leptolyngbya sp. PCC 6406 TaxID=1173264 RepID=UPI0002ABBEFC|nr:hypothetical protein [Leptolyngbya sp. PCC 6406]